MLKTTISFIPILFLLANGCPYQVNESQETFLISMDSLQKNKALIDQKDELQTDALKLLMQRADEILDEAPLSVTFKKDVPPGVTKNDFVSLAPYYWPDPKKKDGLPFIPIDGKMNPLRNEYPDSRSLSSMAGKVQLLGLAYFFSEEEKYAEQAKHLLNVFFIDEKTKMNPHFEFSQLIMGRKSGGNIIDANPLMKVVDGIQLIKGSVSWTARDQLEMQKWFGTFLDWMMNSEKGKFEARRKNNIATFYTTQAATYALFTGNKDLAHHIIETRAYGNIEEQIAPDGSMPMELKRANPWNYVSYNLSAFYDLVMVSRHVDIDLWNYKSEKSGSVKQAYDYVESFAETEKQSFNFNGHYVQMTTMRRFMENNPRPDPERARRDLTSIRSSLGTRSQVDRNNYINILTK